jgi:hypothetical protein
VARRIIALIERHGVHSRQALAAQFGADSQTIDLAVEALMRAGLLELAQAGSACPTGHPATNAAAACADCSLSPDSLPRDGAACTLLRLSHRGGDRTPPGV